MHIPSPLGRRHDGWDRGGVCTRLGPAGLATTPIVCWPGRVLGYYGMKESFIQLWIPA